MKQFYNHAVFLLFIGGLFSLLLTASVVFLKQKYRRAMGRQRFEGELQINPEAVGDVEAKLNDTKGYENPDLLQELAVWGMQPLLIITFASLFNRCSEIEIISTFLLIILILFHEFYLSDLYSNKWFYQLIILGIWLFFFGMISYKSNTAESHESASTSFVHTIGDTTMNNALANHKSDSTK
jgi:hypothetical protein